MSTNIKCELSYDGTNFHGFQIQPNQRTVQGELHKAIYKIAKQNINVVATGRTDAGVHARKQVINFFTNSRIPEEKWEVALNSILPDDIIIMSSSKVQPKFHSRYDVKVKTYRYNIYNQRKIDVFRRHYTWHCPYSLDIDMMKEASRLFIGEHDFTSFSSGKTDIENKVRKIYKSDIWQDGNEIIFQISGSGFLYNMVRIIMGTLIEIGKGKMETDDILKLFQQKNRIQATKTVAAKGLTLWDVEY